MTRRHPTATIVASLVLSLLAAPALSAQIGTPPKITAPIHAARRAVAKTNAHTAAEQKPILGRTPANGARSDSARATARTVARGTKTAPTYAAGPAPASPVSRIPHPASRAPSPEPRDPVLTRETFTYSADGRRDPFVSLMTSGELRPMITDLKLVAVIYDPAGHSVAVLRDLSTSEQYRVTVGKTLGRMRVAAIQPKSVTFTLEEFGYSRQEVLALNDSTTERAQ